ncbi:MAG: NUDIX hydrolase, partial [Lachnospiraceae bacterium]|nr:NUDIX hydrolase [Lachnospiraceae bacterium]
NPCAFSTPGMTDESNAFLCAEISLENTDGINQCGAVGTERFDGFEVLDREQARKVFETGRDRHGNFYSLATWAILAFFLAR